MDTRINVQVRVITAQARAQLQQVQAQLAQLQAQAAGGGGAAAVGAGAAAATRSMQNFTRTIREAGYLMTTAFTVPIALAGGKLIKFAVDNERAFTDLKKVYGDVGGQTDIFNEELDALRRNFEALSNYYGVQQSEVIGIGAAWAQAGVQGAALAESVDNTLRAMVLGGQDAQTATQSLIAIQAQYGASAEGLTQILDTLNAVENQTGINMGGLIDGFSRAAGVARTAGVTYQELAAMLAAMVPASGSATQAGNGLKTMISKILSPTAAAADILNLMGINLADVGWKSQTATGRLLMMAEKFQTLDDAQKNVVTSTLFTNYQINRANVLFEDLNNYLTHAANGVSYFGKAMDATRTPTQTAAYAAQELNTVLQSQPQQLKQIGVILQNYLTRAVLPLIPMLISVGATLVKVAEAFGNLNPYVQKTIGVLLIMLAMTGPLLLMSSAFLRLFSILRLGFGLLMPFIGIVARFGVRLLAAFISPWALIIAGVAAALYAFRNQIANAWNNIMSWAAGSSNIFAQIFYNLVNNIIKAFYALPQGVQNAMQAVVNIIAAAAKAVYELFSYLNPFAHHSPSLVENVTRGMDLIGSKFAEITGIRAPIMQAYNDIRKFGDEIQSIGDRAAQMDLGNKLADLADAGASGSELSAFKQLTNDLRDLQSAQRGLNIDVKAQEQAVKNLNIQLDAANALYDEQSNILDRLQDNQSKYSDLVNQAQDAITNFSNTGITGMRAMDDQIFANTQAQKQLQLQMMNLEDVTGPIDDVTSRLANLRGEIETVSGERESLRAAGAGSDILHVYDDQITALQQQADATNTTVGQYNDLSDALKELQRQGQKLDLQNSLQFDGLTRQVKQAVDGLNELPFDQIMAGINGNQAALSEYTKGYNEATKAVDNQKVALDQAKAARDAVQAQVDAEQKSLDDLRTAYDLLSDSIDQVNESLATFQSYQSAVAAGAGAGAKAAAGGADALSPAAQNFENAAGGNFPDAGLGGGIGGGDNLGNDASAIDALTAQLNKKVEDAMGALNLIEPFKKKWGQFTDWWGSTVNPGMSDLGSGLKGAFDAGLDKIGDIFHSIADSNLVNFLQDVGSKLGGLLKPDVKNLWNGLKDTWDSITKKIFPQLVPLLNDLKDLFDALWPIIKFFGKMLEDAAKIIAVVLVPIIKELFSVIGHVVGPALQLIVDVIGNVLQVIRGFIQVITGILTLDLGKVMEGLGNILGGALKLVGDLFLDLGSLILGAITGLVGPLISAAGDVAKAIWDGIWGGLSDFFKAFGEFLVGLFYDGWQAVLDFLGIHSPSTLFAEIGKNILEGLINGLEAMAGKVWDWFRNLPQVILGIVAGFGSLLWNAGVALLQGLLNGIGAMWGSLYGTISSIAGNVMGWIGNAGGWLWGAGTSIISGLIGGIGAMWGDLYGTVAGLGGRVAQNVGDLGSTLWNAGKNIISGFIGGISSMFGSVKDTLGDLTSKLTSWKGPEDLDKVILKDAGQLVIGGFINGLESQYGNVQKSLQNFTDGLADYAKVDNLFAVDANKLNGALQDAKAKLNMTNSFAAQSVQTSPQTYNEYHFYGDLSFPNITDGGDAQEFLDNLRIAAGGAGNVR